MFVYIKLNEANAPWLEVQPQNFEKKTFQQQGEHKSLQVNGPLM